MSMADVVAENVTVIPASTNTGPYGEVTRVAQLYPYGLCDPLFRDDPNSLKPYRHARGMFHMTVQADNSLFIAKGTEITLFTVGQGDSGVPAGYPASWPVTEAASEAWPGGGLTDKNNLYIIIGAAARVLAPYICTENPNQRVFTPLLSYANGGDQASKIESAFSNYVCFEARFGPIAACRYNLGCLVHMGQTVGPANFQDYSDNSTRLHGNFLPFMSALAAGGYQDSKQLSIVAQVDPATDLVIPTAAGVVFPEGTDICVEIELMLFGFPICARDLTGCCVVTTDAEQMRVVARQVLAEMNGGPENTLPPPAGRLRRR